VCSGIPTWHEPFGGGPKFLSLQLLPVSKGFQFRDDRFQPFKPSLVISNSKCRLSDRLVLSVGFSKFGYFIS